MTSSRRKNDIDNFNGASLTSGDAYVMEAMRHFQVVITQKPHRGTG